MAKQGPTPIYRAPQCGHPNIGWPRCRAERHHRPIVRPVRAQRSTPLHKETHPWNLNIARSLLNLALTWSLRTGLSSRNRIHTMHHASPRRTSPRLWGCTSAVVPTWMMITTSQLCLTKHRDTVIPRFYRRICLGTITIRLPCATRRSAETSTSGGFYWCKVLRERSGRRPGF